MAQASHLASPVEDVDAQEDGGSSIWLTAPKT